MKAVTQAIDALCMADRIHVARHHGAHCRVERVAATLEQDTAVPRDAFERDRREGRDLATNHARARGIVDRIDAQRSASRTC